MLPRGVVLSVLVALVPLFGYRCGRPRTPILCYLRCLLHRLLKEVVAVQGLVWCLSGLLRQPPADFAMRGFYVRVNGLEDLVGFLSSSITPLGILAVVFSTT